MDALVDAGVGLTPLLALASLLPASLYGEGLRRAFVSVAARPAPTSTWSAGGVGSCCCHCSRRPRAAAVDAGWRFRTTTGLVRQGGWARRLGVVLSFLAVWLVLIAGAGVGVPGRRAGLPGLAVDLAVGSFTAANLSGFLHGFVLFASLPLDLGAPFGGFEGVGAGVAVLLWLYLFHVVLLAGYSATLALSSWRESRAGAA